MVNNRGYILHKVGYKEGNKHDYDLYKNSLLCHPKDM